MLALQWSGVVLRRDINALKAALATPGLAKAKPFLDRASTRVTAKLPLLESALSRVDPTLSLHRILARVVAVREETHDVKTFVLAPNARFGTFRPGAWVSVHTSIDGRPVQRSYSLSSAPSSDGLISITVKRVPGGKVSNHLADTLKKGDVIELGGPAGQFVLPVTVPDKLLLISAGSGITPVMSMLRHLVVSGSRSEITFLHFARTPEDVIFGRELEEIAARVPSVHVHICVESAEESFAGLIGRFSHSLLESVAPDYRGTDTFLCGPSGFMKVVVQTLERTGADLSKLKYERFGADFDASAFLEGSQVVRFTRSGVEAISNRPLTILQEAEAKGVRVETGCRAGTCGTCRCRKKKGVVVNVATGLASGDGEEMIYPCVSVAKGTVEVEL